MSESSGPVGREIGQVLARNTAWNYAGFALNLVTNLLLFPFVVSRVGETAAGIWLLVGPFTSYLGFFELGIVPSLTQHVAAAIGAGARQEINRAASTAVMILVLAMVAAAQMLWFVPPVIGLLSIPAELRTEAEWIVRIAMLGFVLRMPLASFQALLLGCQRQDRCNQLWITMAVAKAGATVGLLLLGFGVIAIVTMEAVVHLLAGGLQIRWARQELPDLHLSPRLADLQHARALVSFGSTLIVASLCRVLTEQTDRLIVGAFLTVAQVTHYAAAWKLYMLAYSLPTILLQAMGPMMGHLHGRGDTALVRVLVLRMTKYSAAVAVPTCAAIALAAGPVLQVWMGPSFADARVVTQVLLVAFAVTAFNHAGYAALMGMRSVSPVVWTYSVPQALLNLGLSLLLVRPLGILGVALGTALPAVLLEYPYLRIVLRRIGVPIRGFLAEAVRPVGWPMLVGFAPMASAYIVAGPFWPPLVPLAGVSLAVYGLLFWLRGLAAGEREDLLRLVRARLRPAALEP
jgi:O-antigen/teichoic acid export membrane protein